MRHWRVETQVMEQRRIADFSFFNAKSLEDRLKLRAKSNARLVTAFDIHNSFTTPYEGLHKKFLKEAKSAIDKGHTEDWIELGKVTQTILNACQGHFRDGSPYIPLATFVRVVSFSVVLHVLFGIEPSGIDLNEAIKATTAINRLWIQSKDRRVLPSLYEKKLLDNALEKLLPNQLVGNGDFRPLDLIMPAYETLWRVVLLTFVSIASQNTDPLTAEELREAVKNVPECFCQNNDAEMQALAIAKEGLRLYPPTKRIYRATSTADNESGAISADVEACQRDWRVWGFHALDFMPIRFHHWNNKDGSKGYLEELQKLSYFPFGLSRHICPAAAMFGDKIITLLVVELARHFGTRETGLKIHFGKVGAQQNLPGPLPSGRDDMENWELEVDEGNM
ncbi:hypothetical protein F5Y14DRAFT_438150 [Nemania sp. NC0429]|nr:hypothetical protein F5Y14DRAFT_438150 [Nemania sp. NC0429]